MNETHTGPSDDPIQLGGESDLMKSSVVEDDTKEQGKDKSMNVEHGEIKEEIKDVSEVDLNVGQEDGCDARLNRPRSSSEENLAARPMESQDYDIISNNDEDGVHNIEKREGDDLRDAAAAVAAIAHGSTAEHSCSLDQSPSLDELRSSGIDNTMSDKNTGYSGNDTLEDDGVPAGLGMSGKESGRMLSEGRELNDFSGGADRLSVPVLPTFANRKEVKKDLPLNCQIVGCGKSLISQAEYYQRYRICKDHLRAPALLVEGALQRFCQQCGRFHELKYFDGGKRNCRSRLARHNSRRRKATQHLSQEERHHLGDSGFPRKSWSTTSHPRSVESYGTRKNIEDKFNHTTNNRLTGMRRSREAAFDEHHQSAGQTRPPTLRSCGASISEVPMDQNLGGHVQNLSSSKPLRNDLAWGKMNFFTQDPSYLKALEEIEIVLGKQVVHALLSEYRMPIPDGYNKDIKASANAKKLLEILLGQRGSESLNNSGVFRGPVISPTPVNVSNFSKFGTYRSSPLEYSMSRAGNGRNNTIDDRRYRNDLGSAIPLDSLSKGHLASTVPRSGFGGLEQLMQLLGPQISELKKSDLSSYKQLPENPFLQARNSLEHQIDQLTVAAAQAQAQAEAARKVADEQEMKSLGESRNYAIHNSNPATFSAAQARFENDRALSSNQNVMNAMNNIYLGNEKSNYLVEALAEVMGRDPTFISSSYSNEKDGKNSLATGNNSSQNQPYPMPNSIPPAALQLLQNEIRPSETTLDKELISSDTMAQRRQSSTVSFKRKEDQIQTGVQEKQIGGYVDQMNKEECGTPVALKKTLLLRELIASLQGGEPQSTSERH